MRTRKLLMMINFFPPSGGGGVYRPLSFVKYLSRMSWDITVVTPRPGEFWITDPSLEKAIPDGVRVVRTGSLSASRILGLMRAGRSGGRGGARASGPFEAMRKAGELLLLPDTYIGWRPFASRAASRLLDSERFDALYSTSPPDSTHLAALGIASKHRIPWLADFRDPWIALHLREPASSMHRKILTRMEKRVVMRADSVAVTTMSQEEALAGAYPGCGVVRIPNGYDEEDFTGQAKGPPESGLLTITHCGMLTLGRRSHTFLEGLSRFLSSNPSARGRVRVAFIGARESSNERHPLLEELGDSVAFEDNLPHAQCVARERESHVLLLIKHDDIKYEGLVPGKLYEYIGARRPILALAPPGEALDIISGLRRGETAGPGRPDEVAGALERLYAAYSQGRLDTSYDLAARPELSRRAAAEKLDEELERIARKDRRGR